MNRLHGASRGIGFKNGRLGLLFLSFLFFESCLKPTLTELDFFTVHLNEKPTSVQLGTVRLQAALSDLGETQLEKCGFAYSESLSELLTKPDAQSKVEVAPPVGSPIFETTFEIEAGKTYFFRAYAQMGERLVFSPEAEPFSLSDVVALTADSAFIFNDQATVSGQLIGLTAAGISVAEHGHLISETNKNPSLEDHDDISALGIANDDYVFLSNFSDLKFNKTYYVRAYAVSSSGKVFYSKTNTLFRIKGGWKRIADFPTGYQEGSAIGFGGAGFMGFGCPKKDICLSTDLPKTYFHFEPDDSLGQFTSLPNWSSGLAHTNATSFAIGDTIYIVFGEYYDISGGPFFIRDLQKYSISSQKWVKTSVPQTVPRRTGAVAFVQNGKAYIGSGRILDANGVDSEANDFWEYTPTTGQWRQVASLPLQLNESAAVTTTDGRREAVVLEAQNQIFVGGGKWQTALLRDFWQFTPPESPSDMGSWSPAPFFQGNARFEAVSFSASGKGFYGLGYNTFNNYFDDFWSFDGSQWTQVSDFIGGKRRQAMAFSIGNRGFVGTGLKRILTNGGTTFSEELEHDFYIYVPEE